MQKNELSNIWPDERSNRLLELTKIPNWGGREVTRAINLEYPDLPPVTRNAVLGKLKRLREKLGKTHRKRPRPHTRLNPPQEKTSAIPHNSATIHSSSVIPPNRVDSPAPFLLQRGGVVTKSPITPDDWKPGLCCWPVEGDPAKPDFRYCGRPVIADRPRANYCPEHHAKAHPPQRQKRF